MFERICYRRTRICDVCRKKGQHIRVRRIRDHKYGWQCEECDSIVTDDHGLFATNGTLDEGDPIKIQQRLYPWR